VSGVDLVQWLRDQLDEDERVARACSGDGQWAERDIAIYGPDLGAEVLAHMARHDPARVLREIEAKRQILKEWQMLTAARSSDPSDDTARVGLLAIEVVLQSLAPVYRDRPGYRSEWAP
jgi:hypothetical protein